MEAKWYKWDNDRLTLRLRVQPKASSDDFVGPYGEEYKIRITAPPVDGKANSHLIRFLAKAFGTPKAAVKLISGESSRSKTVRIASPVKFPIKQISGPKANYE